MLLDLPSYFLLSFLEEWISIPQFVSLDTALCNKIHRMHLTFIFAIKVNHSKRSTVEALQLSVVSALQRKCYNKHVIKRSDGVKAFDTALEKLLEVGVDLNQMSVYSKYYNVKQFLYPIVHNNVCPASSAYTGQVLNGKFKAGFGVYRFSDGSLYCGDYEPLCMNEREAKHYYTQPYSDSWSSKGSRIGKCTCTDTTSSGLCPHHIMGNGVYIWSDGSFYSGEWSHGDFHGHGTFNYGGGKTYVGDWQYDQRSGYGVCNKDCGGGVYSGHWLQGKKCGHGRLEDPSGNCYEGQFKDDLRHGEGIQKYENGDVFTGQWYEGIRRNGTMVYSNGDSYTGDFSDKLKHGVYVVTAAGSGEVAAVEYNNGHKVNNMLWFK